MLLRMELLAELKKNPFVLAPMAGITDAAFRSFMREMGCGVVITELVSANGLQYNSDKTRKLMRFDKIQHPIGIQIFGENLDALALAAREVEDCGADFVDLNFGCPVPKVVKKGAGSALLKDLIALRDVLRTVKSAVSIPVTIKIRTGWDEATRNAEQVAQIAFDEGITWVAIHGRTRAAGYSGKADWDYIARVKASSPLPILGNGDIASAQQAQDRLHQSGCDGVMIGRGCLKNPWIFEEAKLLQQGFPANVQRDFSHVFSRLQHYVETHFEERIALLQIRKLAAWYSAGYPESSAFRKLLFQTKEKNELIEKVDEFFHRAQDFTQTDTSNEPFLMGGHG